ncbi:MAG: WbqC family protein [Bacteroidales bacterium]|jgi:hypothetical protein|nr:WbqC family protein [Bacteroidales bacterium]
MVQSKFGVFPTSFFPSVAYLSLLASCDKAAIEGYETFEKQTYRNRTYIQSANGLQALIVPLKRNHLAKQTTNQMRISYAENWNAKHWRAIFSAYGKSPFFEHFASEVEVFFTRRYDLLLDLNNEILAFCNKHFALQTQVVSTQNYLAEHQNDYRQAFKVQNQGTEQGFFPPYYQCFGDKLGFYQNLSCLDLLFCLGYDSRTYLRNVIYTFR